MKAVLPFSRWPAVFPLLLLAGLYALAPASYAAEAERETARQHLDQVVVIGGDARVQEDQVADQVVVVRGNATIEGDVDGDVVVVMGSLKVTGRVRGDVVVVLGEANIDGEVRRDLALILTRGRLGSNADIHGDLTAVGVPPEQASGATVRGHPEIVSLGPLMHYLEGAREYLFQGILMLRPFPPRLGWVWVAAGVFLLFHLVLAVVLADPLRTCMETLREQPARSFLVGLLACILVGPVSLLLSFTVVATPLLWLAFWALCVFGRMAVYAGTGAALGRASGTTSLAQPVPALLVGSVLFYVSYMIPVIGFLVYWIVLPWGIGAVLIRMFEALRRERQLPPGSGVRPPPEPARAPSGYNPLAAATGLVAGEPGPATRAMVTGSEPPSVAAEPVAAPTAAALGMAEPTVGGASPPPPPPPPPPPRASSAAPAPPLTPFATSDLSMAPRMGFWPRFGATLIDLVVVGFLNAVTFGEVRSFWLLLGAYHLIMWIWKGTTLGGSILGLHLIRLDGRPLDWQTCVVRVLGSVVSLLALGIGFFWASWDEAGQSWHDRIAGTTIVKGSRGASLV